MTTQTILHEIGQALFGPRWQSELARELGMSDRHMRRLASGDATLSPGMQSDLLALAKNRSTALQAAIHNLEQAAAP